MQTKLTGGLVSSKKTKLSHVSTTDDDDATTIKFSGGNISRAQLNELIEQRFLQQAAEEEDAPAKKGKVKKGKVKSSVEKPMFDGTEGYAFIYESPLHVFL